MYQARLVSDANQDLGIARGPLIQVIHCMEHENRVLSDQVDDLKREADHLEDERDNAAADAERLRQERNTAEDEVNRLRDQKEKFLEQLRENRNKLEEQANQMQQTLRVQEERLVAKTSSLRNAQHAVGVGELQIQAANEKVATYRRRMKKMFTAEQVEQAVQKGREQARREFQAAERAKRAKRRRSPSPVPTQHPEPKKRAVCPPLPPPEEHTGDTTDPSSDEDTKMQDS